MTLPSPTKSQSKTMDDLRDKIGCAVCLFCNQIEGSQGEIHHILDGQRRISHNAIIVLCPIHHRQGTAEHPSRHSVNGCHGGLALFESTYMDEWELLERSEAWIDNCYYTDTITI